MNTPTEELDSVDGTEINLVVSSTTIQVDVASADASTLTVLPSLPPVIELSYVTSEVSVTTAGATGAQGEQGIQGIPGIGSGSIVRTAGASLGGDRLVWEQPNGTVVYADNTDLSNIRRPVFLTTTAALSGTDVVLLTVGERTEPSWSFTPGPIYLGNSGNLIQSAPTAPGFLLQVGYALTATSVYFNPQPPIRLE